MIHPLSGNPRPADDRADEQTKGVSRMKWEVPQAIDMRYGMEITMYIANR